MADPRRLADAQRRAARARNKATQRDLARAYGAAWTRIRANLDDLSRRIEEARERGERVSASWLMQRARLVTLERQAYAEMAVFADLAAARITAEQIAAVEHGRDDAAALLRAGVGRPPSGAGAFQPQLPVVPIETIAGRMTDGTPIAQHMADKLGALTFEGIRRSLIEGVALGWGPAKTARVAAKRTGMAMARALVIARTETIRAYREASRLTYAANSAGRGGVVTGWYWQATLDRRTCMVCVASHGEFHKPDDPMDTHPACRCTMVPATKPWSEILGQAGATVGPDDLLTLAAFAGPSPTGTEWFDAQPEDVQREMLGPGKFDLYRRGEIALTDLVEHTRSRIWGPGRRERALRSLSGLRRARPGAVSRRASDRVKTLRIKRASSLPADLRIYHQPGLDGLAADLWAYLIARGFAAPKFAILVGDPADAFWSSYDGFSVPGRIVINPNLAKRLAGLVARRDRSGRIALPDVDIIQLLLHEAIHQVVGAAEWEADPQRFERGRQLEEGLTDALALDLSQHFTGEAFGRRARQTPVIWKAPFYYPDQVWEVRRRSERATGYRWNTPEALSWRARMLRMRFPERIAEWERVGALPRVALAA